MTAETFMQRALEEAQKGLGHTRPNPMVGCVVVQKDEIISVGHHPRAGSAHAEVVAIERAGERAKGSDVYVTLEPCDHQGRTGPCTQALIDAQVKRVFVAIGDPNPLVDGRGIARLRQAGIEVHIGLCEEQAIRLNEPYNHFIKYKTPWVIGKIAQTLDGRVATRSGQSQWITGPEARAQGHHLRHAACAILVGVNTVLADNPQLTCRVDGGVDPIRVVLDSHARTPPHAHVVQAAKASTAPTWVVVGAEASPRAVRALEGEGVQVLQVTCDKAGRIDVSALLETLGQRDVMSVLVEGGPTVLGSFADHRALHRLHVFVAPMLLGGSAAKSAVLGEGVGALAEALRLADLEISRLGSDLWITGLVA